MKKVLLPACIVGLFLLSACGGNTPVQDPNNVSMTAPLPASAVPADSAKATDIMVSQPTLPSLPAQPNAANGTGALNPEHGKPGHRCDIAVGAPLNSPVQQSASPTPVLPSQPLPATNASGVARLNPAHGQPGHDCAVEVGQPLKN